MNTTQLASKIMVSMYKEYKKSGKRVFNGAVIRKDYSDEPEHAVYDAIRMLSRDGYITVQYGSNKPRSIGLDVSAIEHCDENTALKKGYTFAKEIRDWIDALKPF